MRSLLELEPHQCRWPVFTAGHDQHFFCGNTREEHPSYCPKHHARSLKRNEREP